MLLGDEAVGEGAVDVGSGKFDVVALGAGRCGDVDGLSGDLWRVESRWACWGGLGMLADQR